MSNTHTIKIKEGFSNGELKLRPRHTYSKNKELIRWTIKDCDVYSIVKMDKKTGVDIYEVLPHPEDTTNRKSDWIAKIKDDLPPDTEYEYSISWDGKYGPKEMDPKITVNPSGGLNFFKLLIGFIVSLFLGFLSFRFLKAKK
ncbi:MAG: hypothetical protein H0V30_05875 [Chitinophagaceae bacterium]|jgi:hypothetical protein|nr:hypothetical protein [Chitinophagaceae bacterium]